MRDACCQQEEKRESVPLGSVPSDALEEVRTGRVLPHSREILAPTHKQATVNEWRQMITNNGCALFERGLQSVFSGTFYDFELLGFKVHVIDAVGFTK